MRYDSVVQMQTPRSSCAVAAAVLMGAVALLGVAIVVIGAGAVGAAASVLAALVPVPLLAALVLLIDRYEPEPWSMLALTFGFGATGAVLIGGILGVLGEGLTTAALGTVTGEFVGTTVIAPVVEEIAKGAAVAVVFWRLGGRFNGVVDGLVYAAMVGLGFHFAEDILYYSAAFAQGIGEFGSTVVMRGVFSAFTHPLFTAMTGIGLSFAAERGRVRVVAPLLGLAGAIALHAIWNGSTYLGGGFALVYLGVFLPVLAAVVGVAWAAARREGRILRSYLAPDVPTGLLSPYELDEIASLAHRRASLRLASQQGGRVARDARRAFHGAAAQLAFSRYRSRSSERDLATELRWVREIARYKRWVDPSWSAPDGIGEF
jgi:RsiW-degrading membrane proteinase PrsW (M82 family)